jgi:hypothetical protein
LRLAGMGSDGGVRSCVEATGVLFGFKEVCAEEGVWGGGVANSVHRLQCLLLVVCGTSCQPWAAHGP